MAKRATDRGENVSRWRRGHLGAALALAAALAAGGCLESYHYPCRQAPPAIAAASMVGGQASRWSPPATDPFAYDLPPLQLELVARPRHGNRLHRAFDFSFPSVGDNRQAGSLVTGHYFESRRPGARRLIVVLPIYGSSTHPPDKITRRLLLGEGGEATDLLLLRGEKALFDWDEMADSPTPESFFREIDASVAAFRSTIIDVRRLLDWAAARRPGSAQRIGLIGFSIGAIVGTVLSGADDRIDVAVLMMGGGHLDDIFASCYGSRARVRAHVLARFGWDRESFRRRLTTPLSPIEPLAWAGRLDPRHILYFDAARDDCIPAASRFALWSALGQPERVSLLHHHRWAFLSMTVVDGNSANRRIVDFFNQQL